MEKKYMFGEFFVTVIEYPISLLAQVAAIAHYRASPSGASISHAQTYAYPTL